MSDGLRCPACNRNVHWNVPHDCTPKRKITPHRAMTLHKRGLDAKTIAEREGVTKGDVHYALRKYKEGRT